ncbi:MAG TPA: hypothetical protein V6D08_11110, partial [Candidatus Obscuribacterales bacterium]
FWQERGGPSLLARFVDAAPGDRLARIITRRLHNLTQKAGDHFSETVEEVNNLFDLKGRDIRLAPGTSHYGYEDGVHPADLETVYALERICERFFGQPGIVMGPFLYPEFNATFICAGGVTSNFLTRTLLEYVPVGKESKFGFQRRNDPVLKLGFEPLCDNEDVVRRFGEVRESSDSVPEPNWPFLEVSTQNVFAPRYVNGKFETTYLLLSVLPNLFSAQAFENGDRVIILGGSHGIATRAGADIIFDPDRIRELQNRISGRHWQALVEIDLRGEKREFNVVKCVRVEFDEKITQRRLDRLDPVQSSRIHAAAVEHLLKDNDVAKEVPQNPSSSKAGGATENAPRVGALVTGPANGMAVNTIGRITIYTVALWAIMLCGALVLNAIAYENLANVLVWGSRACLALFLTGALIIAFRRKAATE